MTVTRRPLAVSRAAACKMQAAPKLTVPVFLLIGRVTSAWHVRCPALVDGEVIEGEPAGPAYAARRAAYYRAFNSDAMHVVMPWVPAWHAVHLTAFAVLRLAGGQWPH